jgi:prevent-host-death family protein
MITRRIGAREARTKFSDLMDSVHYGGQATIIERSGKPMVAVIPVDVYQQLMAEREARFQVPDRIPDRLPDVPPEEVERDVAEAIAAVRSGNNSSPSD